MMKESTFNEFMRDALEFFALAKCLGYDDDELYKNLSEDYLHPQFVLNTDAWMLGKRRPKDLAVYEAYNRLEDKYIAEYDVQAHNEKLDGQQSLFEN